jgi:hypothetical protein
MQVTYFGAQPTGHWTPVHGKVTKTILTSTKTTMSKLIAQVSICVSATYKKNKENITIWDSQ